VVGQVIKVRPHPDGDRVWLADVDIGDGYHRQIVWGGLDDVVQEGSFVPVAPPGAWLPSGKIRRRRYRREISDGMLCSLAELGWDPTVSDQVALLDGSTGLRPGESLDFRAQDWRAIVLPTRTVVRIPAGLHR
jgi:tRNA-binding EMAP/Myf-like protein